QVGPWRIREGKGGGQRVSAATCEAAFTHDDIDLAEQMMQELGQESLFMIRDPDAELDAILAQRGYEVVDPVAVYVGATDTMTADLSIATVLSHWPPLAVQSEIWRGGGIDRNRMAIMERCEVPKTSVLARVGDVPAGTAFVACDGPYAMTHAIHVDEAVRRQGAGRRLMQGSANWAKDRGAAWVCLAVTRANETANSMYRSIGMEPIASYHYRRARGRK
ncbi:MAG: GNAT family N-acetyltransferase, partial [Pseudomonadota bacterium]